MRTHHDEHSCNGQHVGEGVARACEACWHHGHDQPRHQDSKLEEHHKPLPAPGARTQGHIAGCIRASHRQVELGRDVRRHGRQERGVVGVIVVREVGGNAVQCPLVVGAHQPACRAQQGSMGSGVCVCGARCGRQVQCAGAAAPAGIYNAQTYCSRTSWSRPGRPRRVPRTQARGQAG